MIEENWSLHPIFNGHDDLTYWLPDDGLEAGIDIIAHEMCKPRFPWINVPLTVEVSVGTRWDKLEELKTYRSDELFNLRNPFK